MLNDLLNQLDPLWSLLRSLVETGSPSLVILVNVVIVGFVVNYVVWRIKSELRGLDWNKMSFAARRAVIEDILTGAIDMAEWMYSNVLSEDPKEKEKTAKQKRAKALQMAQNELKAVGAAQQDKETLVLRLEEVFAKQHPGKVRFGGEIASARS
jgi:hypothetical protein